MAPSGSNADVEAQPHFLQNRPGDLHAPPPPWHRLAYIVRNLPRRLEPLSTQLNVGHNDTVLDYGCASVPYRRFFDPSVKYLAADLPGNPDATVEIAPDGTLPLAEDSVDAVISTQVLEHVADPQVYLSECFRVLRSGGRLLISTHGIMVYHPDPVDYWRWTCAGLERTVTQMGFRVLHAEGIMGLAATGLQLIQDAYYYRLPKRLRPLFALVFQALAALADRFEPAKSRDMNPMVLAIVGEKP